MKTTTKSPGHRFFFHVLCAVVGIVADESLRPGYVEELGLDMIATLYSIVLSFRSSP
jgi:hypothetical protein